ncbi:DUF3310 domain-containing protein [Dysgonomonas massiliensis]|uniref:DUF3310 domain-containing protein n=1 Tax=Dysgonomonas massiliensis TaxID=2040292 RepID=UPI001C889C17|nr:DUF3310 domain-containing protein [Dysgonomonas massiliensis]
MKKLICKYPVESVCVMGFVSALMALIFEKLEYSVLSGIFITIFILITILICVCSISDGFYRLEKFFNNEDIYMSDNVTKPSHYTSHPSGIECIQITEHYNFCIGNAIKYLWRAGLKQDADKTAKDKEIEDLRKAIWYIERQINNLKQ